MNPQELFCPNPLCPSRGTQGAGNIIRHGNKPERFLCTVCRRTFVGSRGTALYRLQKKDLFLVVCTLLAHGCPLQAIVVAFGLDERTVSSWYRRAGLQAERVHEKLVTEQPHLLQHVQADEVRIKLKKRLVLWMAMAISVPTRLWLGGVVSPTRDKGLIEELAQKVKACALYGPLLLMADGLSSYVRAWQKAFRTPVLSGGRGRRILLAWPVLIGQVVKQYEKGHVIAVKQKMVQGTLEAAKSLLGTKNLNTAYIERINATFRARLASLVRRTRALAAKPETVRAGMFLIGAVYNFCTPHKSLRIEQNEGPTKWTLRTPAMAAELADHIWTMEELMTYRVPPPPLLAPRRGGVKRDQRAQGARHKCPIAHT